MRSLLWKEWHEQRWKLAFGSLILAAFALVGLRARVIADEAMLKAICFLSVLLLPVLSSTGLVPPERAEGTLQTLLALPIRPSVIFAVKTLAGVLLCAVPLILTAAVSVAIAGGREVSTAAIIAFYAGTLAVTLSLFFWMFALTVRLPTETRASLITIGVLIIWMIASQGLAEGSKFWVADPMVFLFAIKDGKWPMSLVLAAGVQAVIALALWLWAARQLSRPQEARS
jgi:ABC-type transport system involved in multi-copper enzyme maturation permease subunit